MINATILISCDHAGFELKEYLKNALLSRGYSIEDVGPKDYQPDDDYPDYIRPLVDQIIDSTIGIIICKNGVGVSVLANRYKNVRCALSWNVEHIKSARNDDNVNVLALPADYVDQTTALNITLAFLETSFSNEERHKRRLKKINKSEILPVKSGTL